MWSCDNSEGCGKIWQCFNIWWLLSVSSSLSFCLSPLFPIWAVSDPSEGTSAAVFIWLPLRFCFIKTKVWIWETLQNLLTFLLTHTKRSASLLPQIRALISQMTMSMKRNASAKWRLILTPQGRKRRERMRAYRDKNRYEGITFRFDVLRSVL